jgi:hypothetical protein
MPIAMNKSRAGLPYSEFLVGPGSDSKAFGWRPETTTRLRGCLNRSNPSRIRTSLNRLLTNLYEMDHVLSQDLPAPETFVEYGLQVFVEGEVSIQGHSGWSTVDVT